MIDIAEIESLIQGSTQCSEHLFDRYKIGVHHYYTSLKKTDSPRNDVPNGSWFELSHAADVVRVPMNALSIITPTGISLRPHNLIVMLAAQYERVFVLMPDDIDTLEVTCYSIPTLNGEKCDRIWLSRAIVMYPEARTKSIGGFFTDMANDE